MQGIFVQLLLLLLFCSAGAFHNEWESVFPALQLGSASTRRSVDFKNFCTFRKRAKLIAGSLLKLAASSVWGPQK